jgi:DNA polymerase I-like protein with 3'-5' exonuclease and polymerase domains|tara:strand:- start:42 stop:641 length:600 start_codon:yes stop_codon:yes gene_type:complete
MARYDNGVYGRQIIEGDIHTYNQQAARLPNRSTAKTFIYGLIYGAGDKKIGEIVNGSSTIGKELKKRFFKKIPALGQLQTAVQNKARTTGVLRGLDGRLLSVRSWHSCLNLLLQSAGALIFKQATILLHERLFKKYEYGKDFAMVANIHDELQLKVKENLAEEIGKLSVQAVKDTQSIFNLRCPLDATYKVGNNWAQTH